MDKIELFYRINITREKKLLEEFRGLYDGVVINAHLAAYYSNWTPAFLIQLNKPYFIDPVTHVFARPLAAIRNDEGLKKSYEKLRKAYGGQLERITDTRQLLPRDFKRTELYKELSESVINFQKNLVADQSQKSLSDYLEILGKKEAAKGPAFLVAPYFYFTSIDDPWYKISLNIARASFEYSTGNKIYAVICTSKSTLLDEILLDKLQSDYQGFDGYLILISDFKERDEEESYLRGLIELIKKVSQSKRPVYMLFGGYFSLILSNYGLTGYSRSICYGDSKKIDIDIPVAMARQPKNYYFNLIHAKIPETVARIFYSDNPNLLCKCSVCSEILSEIKSKNKVEKFFDSIDFNRDTRAHFMVVHHSEIQEISRSNEKLVKKLQRELEISRELDVDSYNISNDYLVRWINTIQKTSERR